MVAFASAQSAPRVCPRGHGGASRSEEVFRESASARKKENLEILELSGRIVKILELSELKMSFNSKVEEKGKKATNPKETAYKISSKKKPR